MTTRAELHRLAEKWHRLFDINAVAQNEGYVQTLEADLKAAGFHLDQFAALTPGHVVLPDIADVDATRAFIHAVGDPQALGNGIHTMWQQVTYWHQASLADAVNRQWFLIAFEQLSKLTQPLGTIRSVTIDSQRALLLDEADRDLMAQQLTIQATGDVVLTNVFGSHYRDQQAAQITATQADQLIHLLAEVVAPVESFHDALTVFPGIWTLTRNGDGGREQVTGDLGALAALSDQIRKVLPFPLLLLFDDAPDRLERLIVVYKPDADTREKLVIDRHSQTLSLTSTHAGSKSRFAIADPTVGELMQDLAKMAFDGIEVADPSLPLALTARFRYAQPVQAFGTLSLDQPIDDWAFAALAISDWLQKFAPQMLDQRILSRNTPKPGDLLYAQVVFHHGEHPYSYLATPEFAIGDRVVVPTTYSTQYGTIVAMNYVAEKNAPFPPEKTKSILRLADPVEESQYDPNDIDDEFGGR
ncbi:hypothetical protein [Lacticaseibacillus sp. N501-2]|uniref:hypothetical protein n=1 Tax=Lacticaseibacillus salsurae TaxID=3367729 RepID=UPI0038B247D7